MKVNQNYVMSICDEINDYQVQLYEAMMDGEVKEALTIIMKLKQVLTDIQKSYKHDEERN